MSSPLSCSQGSYSSNEINLSFFDNSYALLQPQIENVYARYNQIILDNVASQNDQTEQYYVALHGQAISMMVFGDLIKQMEILRNPENCYKRFKFFRVPSEVRYDSVQAFFDTHPFNREVECPYDHFYSDELLSVDVCLENQEEDESAYDFFISSRSMKLEPEEDEEFENLDPAEHPKMLDIAQELLESYSISEEAKPSYLTRIMSLINDVEKNNLIIDENNQAYRGVGNLYVMLLPKTLLNEEKKGVAYLSMEGGVHYDPSKQGLSRDQLLDGLQTSNPEVMQKFIGKDCTFFPQARIICSALTPETGAKMFKLNALSPEFKEDYKAEIKKLAHDIFKGIISLNFNPA